MLPNSSLNRNCLETFVTKFNVTKFKSRSKKLLLDVLIIISKVSLHETGDLLPIPGNDRNAPDIDSCARDSEESFKGSSPIRVSLG